MLAVGGRLDLLSGVSTLELGLLGRFAPEGPGTDTPCHCELATNCNNTVKFGPGE